MSIYEVHPGSWKKHPTQENDGFYSYRDLAKSLADYVCEMGYTHVELMGRGFDFHRNHRTDEGNQYL